MSHHLFALVGNPNCGKTSLFNALTGSRQKVGNYPGVTVERKEGTVKDETGHVFSLLDLPGAYSLDARSPDEAITRDVLLGRLAGEKAPSAVLAVVDATSLERGLGLVLELKELRLPVLVVLNMIDLSRKAGQELDLPLLEKELGFPVVAASAVTGEGLKEMIAAAAKVDRGAHSGEQQWKSSSPDDVRRRFAEIDRILGKVVKKTKTLSAWSERIDRVVLHPIAGLLVLVTVLALVFQAVFNWASIPADWIDGGIASLAEGVGEWLGPGALQSLLSDGIIAGVGSVLVFLPQILILFLFILILEDSGYMARAAFLMDRLMGSVGLSGRSFLPLLSSYACAIPGIMATRTIENPRDRLTTILVAPLTTCSARIPVYTLLISAFIPNDVVFAGLRLQGLVMLGLYVLGAVFAFAVAFVLKRTVLRGPKPQLLLELPSYKWPYWKGVALGLLERARLFLFRAGTVILSLSILIWFLASYPQAPEGATEPAIFYSFAGRVGHALEPLFAPIGFNWRIVVALIPGFAAREIMVSALGTVYAIEGATEESGDLIMQISQSWSLATALSLMMWYVIALQCLATVAVVKRETGSWKWALFQLGYLTAMAYSASFITYRVAVALGWGG